jgi:Acyl-coenzyme A synthetases/AMP-(fatty) acid ligases
MKSVRPFELISVPRHVPDEIIRIDAVPYTMSGKKMETPIKKILLGAPVDKAANKDAMQNGDAIDFFVDFAKNVQEKYFS